MDFRAPFLSYPAVAREADTWLQQYNPTGDLPVPIEEIVELTLGIEIIPFPQLEYIHGVAGTLGGGLKSIVVDQGLMEKQVPRYRFTLAHEVGHLVLHKHILSKLDELWQQLEDKTDDEWIRLQREIDNNTFRWMENHADWWANFVLLPNIHFLAAFQEERENALAIWNKAQPNLEIPSSALATIISKPLAKQFLVSEPAVKTRIAYDRLLEEEMV